MFLFIFESIGTSELLLIGIIALIFLGPRRMPEIARKIGKIMAEFRTTTQEFKSTWEREVNFEEETKAFDIDLLEDERADRQDGELSSVQNQIENSIGSPEIRPIDKESFDRSKPQPVETQYVAETTDDDDPDVLSDKRTWL